MKNKKTLIAIIGVIAVVLVTIGITYAYWLVTKTQTGSNVITAGCLDISLNGEKNDITLTNQFPLSDEEGMELIPYEFTVTNNCNTAVDYQVNLESIGTESTALKTTALKVMLDEGTPTILGYKTEAEPTISGAYASNMLTAGTLQASNENNTNDSATYSLRLWIDADAPISEMNKTYTGKISVTVGQGINHAIEEGTLAYDIVSNYNGVESLSGESLKWVEGEFSTTRDDNIYKTYKYYYGTDYEIDQKTGNFVLSGDIVQSTIDDCRSGVNNCGKYTLKSSSNTATRNSQYTTLYKISSWTNNDKVDTSSYVYVKLQSKKIMISNGLFATPDDLGTSYYLRGDINNNIVKFGKWSETITDGFYGCLSDDGDSTRCNWREQEHSSLAECEGLFAGYAEYKGVSGNCRQMYFGKENTDMYWRIIRINGDGTIRLIYDGNAKDETDDIGYTKVINSASLWELAGDEYGNDDYKYAYKSDSNIISTTAKNIADNWYATNLATNYGEYIADSIFCNDKSGEYEYYIEDPDSGELVAASKDDYEYRKITFNGYKRWENKTPSLICKQKEDRFTTNSKTGNGLLTYPVGYLTMDEAQLIGYVGYNTNYSYTNDYRDSILTMTPTHIDEYEGYDATLLFVETETPWHGYRGARPVINLKADLKFTGSGTIDDPYEIVMN